MRNAEPRPRRGDGLDSSGLTTRRSACRQRRRLLGCVLVLGEAPRGCEWRPLCELGHVVAEEDPRSDNVVIVASKGGHPRHPAWFHNLRSHPAAEVQIGPERRAVLAHIATPGERARLWPKVVEAYAGFDVYQRRTERELPLVVLAPR